MIKKRKSFVPETIKKRLESYPGWSDLVRLRKKTGPMLQQTDDDPCLQIKMMRWWQTYRHERVQSSMQIMLQLKTNSPKGDWWRKWQTRNMCENIT